MKFRKYIPGKRKKAPDLFLLLQKIKELEEINSVSALYIYIKFVDILRYHARKSTELADEQLSYLNTYLEKNEDFRFKFRQLTVHLFTNSDLIELLVENGMADDSGFFSELFRRLRDSLLPAVKNEDGFLFRLSAIFYKKNDYEWLNELNPVLLERFFQLTEVNFRIYNKNIYKNLLKSLHILTCRTAALGTNKAITLKLPKDKTNPFLEQNSEILRICAGLITENRFINEKEEAVLIGEIDKCAAAVQLIHRKSLTRGVSLKETYILVRLEETMERIRLVIDILGRHEHPDQMRFVNYFKSVVENENTKNNIKSHLRQNTQILAYRITEHERNTGEHYITNTKSEYFDMIKSAAGGGFIISFVAIVKNLLHYISMAPFWQSFMYGLNYSIGFVAIQATGATLATKQPAMTASALAKTITNNRFDRASMIEMALTVAKVMRSQTASFFGNLIIAFPFTFLLAFLFEFAFGHKLAEGAYAQELLDQQNPLRSLCLLYACFTGVFLFLSGLISGYFDNKIVYSKIPDRIRVHPHLRRIFSVKTLTKFGNYIGKNAGMLSGNIFLGFCLGFAGFIGYIFGVPFDIRHITISTANFAIGLYGLGSEAAISDIVWTSIGVGSIGFLNFLISFSLALYVAIRSRGGSFKQLPRLFSYSRKLFRYYPTDFIYPPKKERTVEEVTEKVKSKK